MPKNTFDHHAPTPEQIARITAVRNSYKVVEGVMEKLVPVGRHRSIAYTELENSCMRAVKAIIFDGDIE